MIATATVILCSCRSITPSLNEKSAAVPARQPASSPVAAEIDLVTHEQDQIDEVADHVSSTGAPQGHVLPEEVATPFTIESIPTVPRLPTALPPQAWAGPTGSAWHFEQSPPLIAPWKPPGIVEPWPQDEYIVNGGDRPPEVIVAGDWSVRGLEPQDAIIHYDTITGETIVKPTNCVPIYAPRFAAVRKIYGIALHEQHEQSAGVDLPLGTHQRDDLAVPTAVHQPFKLQAQRGADKPVGYRERKRGAGINNVVALQNLERALLAYEDLALVREGIMLNSEKARLAEGIQAALAWSKDEALQVIIDQLPASEFAGDAGTDELKVYELPPGKSKLRVCKLASQLAARPGDVVHFTIRYDNVGDRVVGNMAVLDSLNPRLEYIEESAESSRKAEFSVLENEAGSAVLRWEILEPLEVGQGGVLRFSCRVR